MTAADARPSDRSMWAVGAPLVVLLAVLVAKQSWVTDDALITFRYVDNFLGRRGLVFNDGERVEAFSSPLFLALLTIARGLGVSAFTAAKALGAIFTLAELAMFMAFLRARRVPLAAIAFGASLFCTDRIVTVWATGGLETAMASALVFASFALTVTCADTTLEVDVPLRRASIAHVLLAATRPEGLAFYALHLAVVGGARGRKAVLQSLVRTVPILAALLLARVLYYGTLLPHTFTAKMRGVPLSEFGVGYIASFLRRLGLMNVHAIVWLALPIALVAALYAGRDEASDDGAPSDVLRVAGLGALWVAYGLVIAALEGGDYMTDFRFARPLMGVLYCALACVLARVLATRPGLALAVAALLFGSHVMRQLSPTPMFADAPAPAQHKEILTVTEDRSRRFRAALARIALPGDALLTDWTGMMGLGHNHRTVDATGLTSKVIGDDFYLRPMWSEANARERLPGHARWPNVEMMLRDRLTFIFPKIAKRGHDDAEVRDGASLRHKRYPFLHVTMSLGDGEYFRFFTTLAADELDRRGRAAGLDLCWRTRKGELGCAGKAAEPAHPHAKKRPGPPPGIEAQVPAGVPTTPEDAVKQFFGAMSVPDCEWIRSVIAGEQATEFALGTCKDREEQISDLLPIRLYEIESVKPDGREKDRLLVKVRYFGKAKERTSIVKVGCVDGACKVYRF